MDAKPINLLEFDEIMLKSNYVFEKKPQIAICVSGGPDSLALSALCKAYTFTKKTKFC